MNVEIDLIWIYFIEDKKELVEEYNGTTVFLGKERIQLWTNVKA